MTLFTAIRKKTDSDKNPGNFSDQDFQAATFIEIRPNGEIIDCGTLDSVHSQVVDNIENADIEVTEIHFYAK